ncbi:NEW3 domain-containing protein [Chitinophaga sp. XS-30]|uniref:COG1470 family protein n=1 Tax=Chitinophaga sp. XS-30 TaxID=2604421 RepID=UPI0011DDEAF2|nr:NEW3 domain-containing protein [Chitinophaga sp. XS-30]QEH42949.1 hypothetical protein FW415_19565 [Chitinophaga sp. XS-30]
MPARANKLTQPLRALLFAGLLQSGFHSISSAQNVTLYTPYTKISVPPGQSIDYSIDVINNGKTVKNADIAVTGLPKDWTYELKSGGWSVNQIAVLPGEKKNLSLQVQVPLKINKGAYRFQVLARGLTQLPLSVIVSEQGTFKTEFSTGQANMEGAANSTFTYTATLRNRTADNQVYALRANTPQGWNVVFKANYKQVSSVSVEANRTQDITIEVDPPDQLKAGNYKIPVVAASESTSAGLELEAGITGSYALELTTPQGLLSTDITAGDSKRVELVVRNTGSAALKNIDMQFAAPSKWDVTFDPKKVEQLGPGESAKVFATIKADRKAIAGDYVTNLEAKTPEVSSRASFRISVETSMLWGWVGILIILVALGSVYRLFRKYGRR